MTALLEYRSILLEYIDLFSTFSQHLYAIASYKFLVNKSNLYFSLSKVDTHTSIPPIIAGTSDYPKIILVASYYSRIIFTKLLTYYSQSYASIIGASLLQPERCYLAYSSMCNALFRCPPLCSIHLC